MNIIKPSIEFLKNDNILESLELIGRTCYKSEDRIESGSAEKFIANIIDRGHEAIIEHASYIFEVDGDTFYDITNLVLDFMEIGFDNYLRFTTKDRCIISGNIRAWRDFFAMYISVFNKMPDFLTSEVKTNDVTMRILFKEYFEHYDFDGFTKFKQIRKEDLESDIEILTHWRESVKFICDRGISHEIVRHRANCSYAQESTRYCNYSKDKFGNQLTFILPPWCSDTLLGTHSINWMGVYGSCDTVSTENIDKATNRWFWDMAITERDYNRISKEGWTPEKARTILNNSLKTEIWMTANIKEWIHFCNLRTSSAAHPQIREVANKCLDEFKEMHPNLFKNIEGYTE